MTLPYPPATERDALQPLPRTETPEPSVSADVVVQAMIQADDATVCIGRCRVPKSTPEEASERVAALRDLVRTRMNERRPNATAATWSRLAQILEGMLKSNDRDEAEVEQLICRTIDGL